MSQPLSQQPMELLHHGKWLVLPVLAIAVLALGVWWIKSHERHNLGLATAYAAEPATLSQEPGLNAEERALAQVKPLTQTPGQRPAFVSALEWQVLQGVAGQYGNRDRELLQLVNNLRFTKQLTLWQAWPTTLDARLQRALAQQLLAEIPLHVRQQELSVDDGKALQQRLLVQLVSDRQQRQQRLEQEAAKLRVLLLPQP